MKKIRINEDNIVAVITYSNWVFLAFFTLLGLIFATAAFAASIFIGGLVAIANFIWLKKALQHMLGLSDAKKAGRAAIAKHLLRIGMTAVIAYLLIATFRLHVVGLIIGLSVIVVAIIFTTLCLLILKGG